jgi:hypothetical protein
MARIFVPRMTGFTASQVKEELKKIEDKFKFLTPKDIADIDYWSDPHSPHEGTLINEGATYVCFPSQGMDIEQFKKENPDGEVWEFN